MDPATAAGSTGQVHFLNIEYLFYLIYQLTHGAVGGSVAGSPALFTITGFVAFITTLWIVVTIIAYVLSAAAVGLMVYSITRIKQVEAEEDIKYATFTDEGQAEAETEHHRWKHVRELIESTSPNDWRQAIIEADIILDDMLTRLGYLGDSIGEKLKIVNPTHFRTLQEAWEAHKVRNDIAHLGSEFPLTDHLAYRTILQYENVFKEHGEI